VPVPQCPFWLDVAGKALGADFEQEGAAMGKLHADHLGTLKAPLVWAHVKGWARRSSYEAYADGLGRHYRAIAEVSGSPVVIDSSKMASDALLASTIAGVELKVVHLVRDPRGVAWSWQKEMRQPGPAGRPFARRGPLASAARWDVHNLFAETLLAPRLGDRFRVLRYEDFLAEPVAVLDSLAAWVGSPPAHSPIAGDPPHLSLTRTRHPVWGNPLRTAAGAVPLREDTAWKDGLGSGDRRTTTLATLPLLLRHGYRVAP